MNEVPKIKLSNLTNVSTDQFCAEASDLNLNGYPLELDVEAENGGSTCFVRRAYTRDSEGEILDAVYRGGNLTLTIIND
jgi:hypothetical protein